MLYILIIAFGFIEFLVGCYISFFSKSKWINWLICIICNEQKDITEEKIKELKNLVGQCLSLEGSFYAFASSVSRNYELGYFILMILLILIEVYSYKRMKREIIKIVEK